MTSDEGVQDVHLLQFVLYVLAKVLEPALSRRIPHIACHLQTCQTNPITDSFQAASSFCLECCGRIESKHELCINLSAYSSPFMSFLSLFTYEPPRQRNQNKIIPRSSSKNGRVGYLLCDLRGSFFQPGGYRPERNRAKSLPLRDPQKLQLEMAR